MMIAVIILMGSYLYYHLLKVIQVKKYQKIWCAVILLGIFLLMFLSRYFLGFMIHILVALMIVDIVYLVVKKTKWKAYFKVELIALIIASLLTGYGIYNVNHLQYVQYDVYVDKEFVSKRILAISDVHLSTAINKDDLALIKEKVKSRQIDMVFLLGDLFDESTDENEAKEVIQFFDELTKTCPVYYIVGNHDGSQGRVLWDTGLLKTLDESDIVFLKDEVVFEQGIYIVGRLDQTYPRKETSELLEGIDKTSPIIVLDHQPRQLQQNASFGVDLQLSGHTHNGQIWPAGTLCKYLHINEMEYGYEKVDDMTVIVSSGMGAWGFAMKSQGKSEIVEINLKQK